MLFADFIKRLMPIAQSAPEFREHFPPASWKRLFDLAQSQGEDSLLFDADQVVAAGMGAGRIDDVVLPFVRALNAEFAGSSQEDAQTIEREGATQSSPWEAPEGSEASWEQGPMDASSESLAPEQSPAGHAPAPIAPQPAPARTPEEPSESPGLRFSLPEYDFSRDDIEPMPRVEVSSVDAGTALQYSWADPGDGELFRVVTSDHEPPFSPDESRDSQMTWSAVARDERAMDTSVRFVTVWGYEVLDRDAGTLGQARKVAEGVYVQPVQDWTIEHDRRSQMVFSSWHRPSLPTHVTGRVRVAKLPLGEPINKYLRGQSWLRSNLEMRNNGQGFQDGALQPGQQHTYVAGLEVEIEGRTLISAAKHLRITPEAEPDRIEDLEVESITRDRQEQLRLTWTQLRGTRVRFSRSRTPARPEAVSRGRIVSEQLPEAGLPPESFIRNIPSPTGEVSADGRERWVLEGLDWPRGAEWDTLHLTPVTEIDGKEVLIGAPAQLRRAGRIEEVRLVQRMNWQLVTFTWPGDALAVELRIGFPDSEPDLSTPAHAVVEKTAYERSGGFRLDRGLPPQGCRLFLNAVTHFQGQRISSEATIAAVEALWGYQYGVEWGVGGTRGSAGFFQRAAAMLRKNIAELSVDAVLGSVPEHEAPSFVLLHRPDRLPLHSQDGTRVSLFAEKPGGQVAPQPFDSMRAPLAGRSFMWFDEDEHGPGWYRLMVDARPSATVRVDERRTALERYALSDPDLSALDRRA